MLHEASAWEHSSFWTLTYAEAPEGLRKEDLQRFFKRMRKAGAKFRYYACGEYGERFGRPHYHAILFGVKADDPLVEEKWALGHVRGGSVTYDSCRYVADYVQKVWYGEDSPDGRSQPFALMSKGLGRDFIDNLDVASLERLSVRGHRVRIPRYYLNRKALSGADVGGAYDAAAARSRTARAERIGFDRFFDEVYLMREQMDKNLKGREERKWKGVF